MTAFIDQAIQLHRQGRLRLAVPLYKQALAENPLPSTHHFLGMAYFGLKKFKLAVEHLAVAAKAEPQRADFQAGYGNALYARKRYPEATAALQAAVLLSPDDPGLWFNLGNAAQAVKDIDLAIEAFEKALALDPLFLQALVNLGAVIALYDRFTEFCALLERVYNLKIWNGRFSNIALLGIPRAAIVEEGGEPVVEFLHDLLAVHPQDARLPWLIGHYHFMRQEFKDAQNYYEQSIALDASLTDAKRALSILLAAEGEIDRARLYLRESGVTEEDGLQALKLSRLYIGLTDKSPEDTLILNLLCEVFPEDTVILTSYAHRLLNKAQHEAALNIYFKLAILQPEEPSVQISIGGVLMNLGRDWEAARYLRKALELDPKNYTASYNLALVCDHLKNTFEALKYALQAIKINPKSIDAVGLASTFASRLHQFEESERILALGLKNNPKSIDILSLIGNEKMRRGNMKEAVEYYARARKNFKENSRTAGSTYAMQLMTSNYTPDISPEVISEMHFKWGDATMALYGMNPCAIEPPTVYKKKLRIGYMSGDYKAHSCSHFMAPVIGHHHAERVDVFCYMTERANDQITMQFRRDAPHWRNVSSLIDQDVIKLIQEDEIDILVDLSGHTSGSRLPIFAAKPAPIQVTWLGYPNTTGLPTMDYRFTDAYADPPGMTEQYHRETLYRLPNFLCYEPRAYTPSVSPLPARTVGRITFGCFNNSNKITDQVVETWAAILKRVENSRIFLKTGSMSDGQTLQAFREKFEKNGITPERVECFVSFPNTFDHLSTYSEIDLTLDPFPYNGTTTTFEALWMGVPMITLEGKVHASRVGHSIMSGIGAGELSAATIEDYIEKAVALAHDLDRIEAYRKVLRDKLQNSPLMDAEKFVTSLENAYFDMWGKAVEKNQADHAAEPRKDYAL
jgi:predicted O-linked N-acetylglucosamine transferase (SPINDLY family)